MTDSINKQEFHEAISGIHGAISGIREEVSGVRAEVSGVRAEVSGGREEVSGVREAISDIHEAIHDLASHVDVKIDEAKIELREEFRREIRQSEAATRDFVDRRVTAAVAEIAPIVRKVDEKDSALVNELAADAVIPQTTAADIQSMSPFAAR